MILVLNILIIVGVYRSSPLLIKLLISILNSKLHLLGLLQLHPLTYPIGTVHCKHHWNTIVSSR